ncbi:mucin-2 [Lutzomyia longipalpis]|uniref:mucin-2 n=1 Tax=Lutzomyia longipalpis TaxID=7200 RepID=UPI0024839891|nr:mucin-2 [Lutzomyia longipalpis]
MDSSPRNALFREIHKNTWLKRITSDVKKLTVGAKRSEKFWVVFCVHDDFDALLEGYMEPRMAPSHSPEWTVSLQQTQHISHALVPLEQEYEFVITLSSDVVRFSASSWEIMQEWVDTLRSKLREMKILSPRENIYSKLPEIRPPLLPTRDPTSPLPAPPPVPAALVPGIERIVPPTTVAVTTAANTTSGQNTPTTSAMSNTLTQNLIAMLSSPIANLRQHTDDAQASGSSPRAAATTSTATPSGSSLTNGCASPAKKAAAKPSAKVQQSLAKTFTDNVLADPNTCPPSTSTTQDVSTEASTSSNGATIDDRESDCTSVESLPIVPEPIVIPRPQTSQKRRQSPSRASQDAAAEGRSSSSSPKTNVTIIQVTNTAKSPEVPSEGISLNVSPEDSPELSNEHQFKYNVKINPSIDTSNKEVPKKKVSGCQEKVEISSVHIPSTSAAAGHYGKICNVTEGPKVTVTTTNSNFATNISVEATPAAQGSVYEQVFITTTTAAPVTVTTATDTRVVNLLATQARSASHSDIHVTQSKSPPEASSSGTPRKDKKSPQKVPSRPMLTRGVTEAVISRPSRIDKNALGRGRCAPNGEEATTSMPKTRPQAVGAASGQDQRKRSSSTSDAQQSSRTARPAANAGTSSSARGTQAPPFRPPPEGSSQNIGRLTLREQQVMHMRREMMHPGGVRLQLRRKDCLGSIAWVDAFGAVWVSGWKQKEHPMLYNALHVGDQLISVGGVTVGSAADANKLIRSSLGLYVELIIRRVPFGRCYAIRRDLDGQCLGLVRDCATVVDLVPNSLAARHGLPQKAQTCDGLSLTFWVLTEINGRPLNLFAKENEVKDRLNAVGRDISILVQPSDLVAKLKKQLKSLRSHKDYIVQ